MRMNYLLGWVFMLYVCAACSDDDNNNPNYAEKIAGTYEGYSAATFQYSPTPSFTTGQKVVVTRVTDKTVSLSYTDATWGTYRLEEAGVTSADGKYAVSGNGKVSLSMGANASEYDYTLTATVSSGQMTLSVKVPAVMGGISLTFQTGEVPNGVKILGEYVGKSSTAFQYSPDPIVSEHDTLSMTANLDGTANFSYVNGTFGKFTVKGMEVTFSDDNYSFSGQDSVAMGMGGSTPKKYFFTLEGSIDATTRKASFIAKVPAVMGGVTVTYTEGVKQEEN